MSLTCGACGKTFKYDSSLARHRRGNVKTGVAPCFALVDATAESLKEGTASQATMDLAAHYLGLIPELGHIKNEPELVPFRVSEECLPPFLSKIKLMEILDMQNPLEIPRTYLSFVYMNPHHPLYWSVLMVNDEEVKVWDGRRWSVESLRRWGSSFIFSFVSIYATYYKHIFEQHPQRKRQVYDLFIDFDRQDEAIALMAEDLKAFSITMV